MSYRTQLIRYIVAAATVSLLEGCLPAVTVDADFPPPLVEPYDLAIGISYPEILADYVEVEESPAASDWEITLGNTNMRLFNSLFGSMFTEVRFFEPQLSSELETDEAAPAQRIAFDIASLDTEGLDAVIEPVLEDLEVSLPAQSGTELYGVWMKYTLNVYSPDGAALAAWPITGFGQVGKNSLTAAGPVRAAAVMAMRDAATNIILNFENQPALRQLLNAPEPAVTETEDADDE